MSRAGHVAFMGLLALWPVDAFAAFPGQNGRIFVTAQVASPCEQPPCLPSLQQDLLSIDPDGTRLRRHKLLITYDLAGSPDGGRLAFSNVDVYVARTNGTGVRTVADDGAFPAWSPDGKRLVFSNYSYDSDKHPLMVVGVDGRGLRRLGGRNVDGYSPTWSPDGRQIAFLRYRTGGSEERSGRAVYVVPATGGRARLLYAPPFDWGDVGTVDWSPDGRRLLITISFAPPGDREGCIDCPPVPPPPPEVVRAAERRVGINVIRRDGRRARRLTTRQDGVPVWSPDGKWIAFGDRSIWTMRVRGGSPRKLLEYEAFSSGARPAWVRAR